MKKIDKKAQKWSKICPIYVYGLKKFLIQCLQKIGFKSLVKIGSLTAEIFLIWTIVSKPIKF